MSTQLTIPTDAPGTWLIDAARSTVSFKTRMLGFIPSGGTFDGFEGTITLAENPLDSGVKAVIRTASVNTKNARRDADVQKDGYLSAATYPTMTFSSTGIRQEGDVFLVDGDFTALAVTRPLTLRLVPGGFATPAGKPEARFTATTQISNKAFGVTKGAPFVTDTTQVVLDVVATKQV